MSRTPVIPASQQAPSHADHPPDKEEQKAAEESQKPTVSKPGGFQNDPDDPTNPNEEIERHRRKLRP